MKPIKLKELIATAKDPATQQIAIAEKFERGKQKTGK